MAQQSKQDFKNTNVLWEGNKKRILSNRFIIPSIMINNIYKSEMKLHKYEILFNIVETEFLLSPKKVYTP